MNHVIGKIKHEVDEEIKFKSVTEHSTVLLSSTVR